jgi:hypothetical protein
MHTCRMVALNKDALTNEAVFIQAVNAYEVSKSKTIKAENALSNAQADEGAALDAMNHADGVWTTTLRNMNAEEEILDTRAKKFRALVNASGLTTRVPSTGFSSTWTESDEEVASPVQYNPKSPQYDSDPHEDDTPNICFSPLTPDEVARFSSPRRPSTTQYDSDPHEDEVASPASVHYNPTSPKYDSDPREDEVASPASVHYNPTSPKYDSD